MTTATRQHRLFFALWPDPATRAALARLQQGVAGKPSAPAKLHLTMAFLGQRPDADLAPLCAILQAVAAPAMTLELDCYGHFSGQRIAWAGMGAPPAALLALRAELMRLLAQAGFAPEFEHDRFRPHVTLARKAPAPAAPPPAFAPLRWRADELVLAASTGPDGYHVIGARRLE
ncbi:MULTISPECIES: RNA 2',3'-cyclic phosphodiesterase [unclassified Janthinobacterium]|uniref:RNA 2',3'-cyclic phosphodiesterase n=1 Tax=unclassified Janthinobacterium TaxID=2610881 RepID=UPI00034B49DF|nr:MULTISPECIES: RNA 2',3'-cyclic phosphodiesterase [unclassified Janthinobacterium]MEC5163781.1 2'-5' RNA ligase [Janthinobacterium sp. CG_S6]